MRSHWSTILLTIAICTLQLGCKKEKPEPNHNLIAPGCIPKTIVLDEPILGGYSDTYKYENGKLTGYGSLNFEYENGLVKRIRLGQYRYEEYFYNNQFKVIQTMQYRRPDLVTAFKVVDDKTYAYNDSLIIKVTDNDENLIHEISYYPNTNNIDSIKTFNSSLELVEVNVFKYDQANNVIKNLLMPTFNFFHLIEKFSNNNVTQHKIIELTNPNKTTIFNYKHIYNSYNYPIEVNGSQANSGYTTKTRISYINCQ